MSKPKPAIDPQRYNFYHIIHKALRLGHCRVLAALGSTDFTSEAEAGSVLAKLRAMIELGKSHLQHENREIHTALEARMPGASAHAAHGHDDHEKSFAELNGLMRAVEAAPASQRAAAGNALYHRYAMFAVRDIEHMNEEETDILAALHRAFTDAELRAIDQRIVAAIPPEKMAVSLRLIMPALNHAERLDMLGRMQAGMPATAFSDIVANIVRPALEPEAFAALAARLMPAKAA